jgi:glycosyltransferase involved in cell wall biosynthesis
MTSLSQPIRRFSVVTACFNSAATIDATLDSAAAQTFADVEHIVVDGASRDGTQDRVRARGSAVSVFVSEPDRGVYDAMNKGIERATGDVICILNADDVYAAPDVLARVAERFATGPLDAVLADVAFFHPGARDKLVRRYDSGQFAPERIAFGWMPAHTGMFLRTEVYRRFGLYKPDYRISGDFEFIARAFKDGGLNYEHMPEVAVHMQTGGLSTAGLKSKIVLNREIVRACRENGIKTNLLKVLSKYPQKILELARR